MIFYGVCDTSCSSLQGTLLGLDLKVIGILYMAALLVLTLPPASRWAASVRHLRTMLLSGALGGEILLVRFQVVHDTYCPFCLAFGSCILVLFAANFMKMNKYLALGAFLTGIAAFALFFEGSVLPLYKLAFHRLPRVDTFDPVGYRTGYFNRIQYIHIGIQYNVKSSSSLLIV